MSDRLLGIGGGIGRHHRNVIGVEQPLDFDRIEPLAVVGERIGDNSPGSFGVGRKRTGHRRRDLRQRLHQLTVPHQMHEATHRVVFGRIVRNPGTAEDTADLLIRTDPGGEHRLW